jgi:hypothetical protein
MWVDTKYLASLAATIRLPFFEVYERSIGYAGSMTLCELITDYDPRPDIPYSPPGRRACQFCVYKIGALDTGYYLLQKYKEYPSRVNHPIIFRKNALTT